MKISRSFVRSFLLAALFPLMGLVGQAQAGEGAAVDGVPLGAEVAAKEQAYAKGVTVANFTLNGASIAQDRSRKMLDDFKDPAARKCKPFCVQPATVPGATTVLVEDFAKMAGDISSGKVLIVDMRTEDWFKKETIPGSVNIPYSDLTGKATKAQAKIKKLEGKDLIAFCNGWWCGQSPTGIAALVGLQYPGKLYYFRGGSQDWADAGLPFVVP